MKPFTLCVLSRLRKSGMSHSLTVESMSAEAIFTPGLLSDLNCIGFFLFHDRAYIKHAFVALLRPVMNAWLKYLSGGSGSLGGWEEGGWWREWGKRWWRVGGKWKGDVGACSEWETGCISRGRERGIKKGEDKRQVCCSLAATAYGSWHHSLTKPDDVSSTLISFRLKRNCLKSSLC